MDPLEKAILEGGISQSDGFGPERRRDGHDPEEPDSAPNTDDELGSALSDDGAEPLHDDLAALQDAEQASDLRATNAGRKGGPSTNTGPKGVLNDKRTQERLAANRRNDQVNAVNARLQGMALNANTWDEEEKQRRAEAKAKDGGQPAAPAAKAPSKDQASIEELAARERRREARIAELKERMSSAGGRGAKVVRGPSTWFGHLREVDAAGYADAIDKTEETTMVVVHIYSKVRMQLTCQYKLSAHGLLHLTARRGMRKTLSGADLACQRLSAYQVPASPRYHDRLWVRSAGDRERRRGG